MKKFSILYDANNPNPLRGYEANESKEIKKRFYVDEQNIITDDECEDDDGDAFMNLFLSCGVKDFFQDIDPKEANKVADMNDTIRFVDVLVDLLNENFNPETLGRVAPIYIMLTFAILADFIWVSHIDIWDLCVNGQCSDDINNSLRHRITVIGDRDKE